jgi:cytochrome oxidase Cu insertion factor (SCO1/SenC/PrrC family)
MISIRAHSAFAKVLLSLALATSVNYAFAQAERLGEGEGTPNERPKQLENVGITEQLGKSIDPNIPFKDDRGNDVTIGSYLGKDKPVLLSLAYYNCPGLCNFHLNGMVDALKEVPLKMGKDFDYVVVSFDSKE